MNLQPNPFATTGKRWSMLLATGLILTYAPGLSAFASPSTEASLSIQQSAKKYEGVMVDVNTGEPLIGASIQIKGTTTGVITDFDGRFEIEAQPGQTLVFSYMGYKTKEIKVGNIKLLSVEMIEDSQALGEVVVTAFGVGQKKESIVGAVTQVRSGELKVPAANLSNSFAGRMSGVTAFQRSGEPGNDGSNFFIRGISTFTATSPLIIIDGVEASAGDLNALDSEVIESFSILKDATATAMYGTRGANGVMIVKTKSGENTERAIINARIETYVSMPTKVPKFTDAVNYMNMYNQAARNYSDNAKLYDADFINGVAQGLNPYRYPNVDWYNELFRDATINERVNFNVRGGSKRVDYFINANMNHEMGMLKNRSKDFYSYDNNIDVMRYTFQTNINAHLSSSATVSMNLGVELRDTHGPSVGTGDLFGAVMNSNPVDFPMYFPTGTFVNQFGTQSDYIKWGGIRQR